MIKLMIGLSFAALAASAAAAQSGDDRWVRVGGTRNSDVYVDVPTIRRSGTRVTHWQRTDFSSPQEDGEEQTLAQWIYDCRARTSDLVSWSMRDGNGTTLRSRTVPRSEREVNAILPESVGESVYRYLCE